MARKKTDAERGPIGAWAYNTRDALGLSVEQVIPLLPTTYHPATLRKAEGGTVPPGTRMWRELGNLYGQLAEERHVPIDAQPRLASEPTGATETPVDLVEAINAQTEAINALVDRLDLFVGPLGEVMADLLRDRVAAATARPQRGAPVG